MVTITYFVHCTTTDNEASLATGWLPGELSELGKKQAIELAKVVAGRKFDVVISSDLHRAVETASVVFGEDFLQDARLREANYGGWNGKEESLVKLNMPEFVGKTFPSGESYKDVEKRMRELCKELLEKYDGKHVALMAHQAPQLALEVICNGKTWEEAIATDWRRTKAFKPGWKYQL
jgi:broad specificity phosphatase PhoE